MEKPNLTSKGVNMNKISYNFLSIVFFVFSSFIFSLSVFPQTPEPSATPPINDETIKISTTLIQIDVSVTDKKGNFVTDLKPEDFEVYENGKKQDITNFSLINAVTGTKTSERVIQPKGEKGKIPIAIPPVKLKPEQVRRTYALVVDDLGLNFGNIYWVRDSLKKFINEQMQEGDLVAIIRTGAGIGALQAFTSDKRMLLAAIDKIKWNAYGRSGIGTFEPIQKDLNDEIAATSKSGRQVSDDEESKGFKQQVEEFRRDNFSVGTLGALNYIIKGMSGLPGRKAVILFSEGFVLTSTTEPHRIFDSMRSLADLANRSSVVIYTIDPRGLQVPRMALAEDDITEVLPDGFDPGGFKDPRTPRENDFRESQTSLRYLAYETGGIPFINQNNINKGILRAVNDQGSFYLLGYQPDETTFDPKKNKFNKLEVKLLRPDLKIRYRSGFFAYADDKNKKNPQQSAQQRAAENTPQNAQQRLVTALTSPFGADEIKLDMYLIFYNESQDKNFIRSLVYIDPKDLNFTRAPDGTYQAKFDVSVMMSDSNGLSAGNGISSHVIKFTKEQLSEAQEKGVIYDLPVPIVNPGAYQFRIGLQDFETKKIGAVSQFIEVPNIKKQMAVSNFILHDYTADQWQKVKLGDQSVKSKNSLLLDTTLRQFKRGTILRYDYIVYNPKQSRQLRTQLRLIRDGKTIYEEPPVPLDVQNQTELSRVQTAGAITLGKNLEKGNYILQIVVTDGENAKNFATQFVEFEILD